MKKLILLFSVVALVSVASCKNKEKSKKTNDTNNTSMQSQEKYRFVVSFFSIGTGIDTDAMTKLEAFVNNHPKKPVYETFRWGREGETELAFTLKEFKKTEQAKFIEELKKAIGNTDRVRYKENEVAAGKPVKKEE